MIPTAAFLASLALATLAATLWPWSPKPHLVLYCAHDLPFVESLVREFEEETHFRVLIVADTEATKSLGLVRRIVAEKSAPQADVFWNNQLLGTLELSEQGLLAPLRGPNADRFAGIHRGRDWVAFGGRVRVWITRGDTDAGELLPSGPDFCVADPLFGTTLTHAALLWDRVGKAQFTAWFEGLAERGTRVVPGNSATRDLVVDGTCRRGWTDTDDAFGALDRGAEVSVRPVLVEGRPVVIPNTVSLVRGGPHPVLAEICADWLLSEAVERRLAAGPARQIPLGRLLDPAPLPPEVDALRPLVSEAVDLRGLLPARRAVVRYLSER